MGDPNRECYSRIDPSPLASSVWLCEVHQHKTVLNVGTFFPYYYISLTIHPQYRCNRQLSGIFRVHVLNPLIIVHVYGSDEDIVPTSINWRHLDDFFSASADRLVRSEIMPHFLYANCATQLVYISINCKTGEHDEGRRKGRQTIEEAVAQYPAADVAVIISAHTAPDGSLVHQVENTMHPCKSTPLGVSQFDLLQTRITNRSLVLKYRPWR